MTPDLVLLSARLLDPGTGELLPHTALAAGGGRITHLGDDREIRALAGPGTTVLGLRQAVVTAGFTDGHLHPVSGAERTMGVDLSACRDLPAVRAALAEAVATLEPGAWLRGWGLDPNAFGGAPVGFAAIGPVLDGVPALLDLFDAHSLIASPRALQLAGVTGPRRFEQAAEIVCDAEGRPTGLLLEDAACEVVEAVAPRPTEAQLRARTAEVLHAMAAAGLTGGHAMDANGDSLATLAALEDEDGLPLRLRVAPWCQPGADAEAVRDLIRLQGTGGRLWRVAGVKLFMDGTIDNGTAWLERPDCHGESTHAFWPDPERYAQVVAELHEAGWRPPPTPSETPPYVMCWTRWRRRGPRASGRCGTGWSTSRRCPTTPCGGSPRSGWPPPCSPPTAASSPAPTTPTTGPAGSVRSAPRAPSAAATCGTPGPGSCSAPTGPSHPSRRWGSWPAPAIAAPPTSRCPRTAPGRR
ncbi:hypothetical protein OQI_34270 [Streptomyces pharetrae CZA14]|uniref:Amidohydrolase 3 domain-containing protein n=1 Tax=Streptomyces pharetrae CZA14 TaxID=1144883 RepID=A0ABX3Y8N4_9ACTN|nr:hypothetical protein OQI_34270 [Streptomyces pharetrae CZA14]